MFDARRYSKERSSWIEYGRKFKKLNYKESKYSFSLINRNLLKVQSRRKQLPKKLFEYFFHDNCIFGGMCKNKTHIDFSNH